MNERDSLSSSTLTGIGEFERKGVHIIATVVVHSGCVDSVSFASKSDDDVGGVAEVVKRLAGTPLSKALEITVNNWEDPGIVQLNKDILEVMLEAFYRAVETCLVQ